jgi:hypothetical protein
MHGSRGVPADVRPALRILVSTVHGQLKTSMHASSCTSFYKNISDSRVVSHLWRGMKRNVEERWKSKAENERRKEAVCLELVL